MTELSRLDTNTRRVIYERHHGWEKASYAQLAAIFRVRPETIRAVCRDKANAESFTVPLRMATAFVGTPA